MTEPRFVVTVSTIPGAVRYNIHDTRTGMLARNLSGRPYRFADEVNAERKAERLNRKAVCLGCRHRRPVADMVDRRCPECVS